MDIGPKNIKKMYLFIYFWRLSGGSLKMRCFPIVTGDRRAPSQFFAKHVCCRESQAKQIFCFENGCIRIIQFDMKLHKLQNMSVYSPGLYGLRQPLETSQVSHI